MFHRVLRNEISLEKEKKINRLIICSGKIYFELQDHIQNLNKQNIFILRLEQIYPFPYDVFLKELKRFKDCEIIWCQEEPKNMGAYGFVKRRIESIMKEINFKQSKSFSTPKRLVFTIDGISEKLEQKQKVIKGPRANAPNEALEGFIKSNNLNKSDIYRKNIEKGEFYFANIKPKIIDNDFFMFILFTSGQVTY